MIEGSDLRRQFASDNYSGICPEVWQAMADANHGHTSSYGADPWTERASDLLRQTFECDCEIFFVFNGTAANSLTLASLCRPYHSIICHEKSHIETDECGAPEFFSGGAKLLTVPGQGGKLDLNAVRHAATCGRSVHSSKPRILSLTQSTEFGTVYSADEIRAACSLARELGLGVHMDGARFANAVASLNVKPRQITWEAGVDVLCLGGTKNGMPIGEAVIFFNKDQAHEFDYRRKQAGQLASKMRFIAAGWVGLLENGTWLKNAAHANRCAQYLEEKLRPLPGIKVLFPRQANAVFAEIPLPAANHLTARGWKFYNFVGPTGFRLMTSWDTTEADIDAFTTDLKSVL